MLTFFHDMFKSSFICNILLYDLGHWYVALFFICFSPVYTISMCNYEMKNRVIIVAMLNLHDETSNCTKVSLRGLQQQAIAEKTAADINSNVLLSEGMNVGR